MKIARCICPACDQSIELPEQDTLTRVDCPACKFGFVPSKYVLVEPEPAPVAKKAAPNSVREWAWSVSTMGKLAFILCIAVSLITFYVQISGDSVTATPYLVAGGFFMLGLWFQVIAQLMFIRAAVEEK